MANGASTMPKTLYILAAEKHSGERGVFNPEQARDYCKEHGVGTEGIEHEIDTSHLRYQNLGKHIRVWREDGESGIGWDELQAIKNEVFGDDATCIEIYPPKHEVVNEVNMRHLWLVDPEDMGSMPNLRR